MTPQNINSLRERFFKECTEEVSIWEGETDKEPKMKRVNMTPHNLFEWFISQPELKEERGDYVASSNQLYEFAKFMNQWHLESEQWNDAALKNIVNDFVASQVQSPTSVVSLPCTDGNSIQQSLPRSSCYACDEFAQPKNTFDGSFYCTRCGHKWSNHQ